VRICIIGAGHVGLVTAAVFADLGNEVVCLDVDRRKVEGLRANRVPIFEPGLSEIVARNQTSGRLAFTWAYEEAIPGSEVVFIAVDTPTGPDGKADLSSLLAAARALAPRLDDGALVVTKSTVPVGSGLRVREALEDVCPDKRFEVASCPEFLREGSAIADSLRPDRVVIGCTDNGAAAKLIQLYAPLERPMLFMDLNSAELVKYAANSFLAMRISFINSIADLCEQMGADIAQVIKGLGADTRIGRHYLSPGLGYGGSCFPKDTAALAGASAEAGYRFELLEAVIETNRQRIPRFVERMRTVLGGLEGKTIAVLGLSFKPDTEDIRASKAVDLVSALLDQGAKVRAYDPAAMDGAQALLPEPTYCPDPYEVARGADALVIATEWNEFKLLDLARLRDLLHQPIVFDGRNIYEADRMAALGFRYVSVGRPM
jgi:UDPglucose 6-dehydrogenase